MKLETKGPTAGDGGKEVFFGLALVGAVNNDVVRVAVLPSIQRSNA